MPLLERRRPSLSVIMSMQRRRWVANAVRRETPLDAILSGNLMGSVSFLASTTVLLVLAIFTAFGNLPALIDSARDGRLPPELQHRGRADSSVRRCWRSSCCRFFAFTLALRQFNHFCIMLGAIDHSGQRGAEEIDAIAQLNTMAARNFNNGIRAYYFAVPMVSWFVSRVAGDRRQPRHGGLPPPPRVLFERAPHGRVGGRARQPARAGATVGLRGFPAGGDI